MKLGASNIGVRMNRGIELINEERKKQLKKWKTPGHDASINYNSELVKAAAVYALNGRDLYIKGSGNPLFNELETVSFSAIYPWDNIKKIESKDRLKQLQIAGALIAAEIDRLIDRI